MVARSMEPNMYRYSHGNGAPWRMLQKLAMAKAGQGREAYLRSSIAERKKLDKISFSWQMKLFGDSVESDALVQAARWLHVRLVLKTSVTRTLCTVRHRI